MSFELAVQGAIYAQLLANADIISEGIPVYDAVPQPVSVNNNAFPYITIGEDNHVTIDSDDTNINQVSITIHTWSRQSGRAETKKIQGYIYGALHRASLTSSGYKFINLMQDSSTSFYDADGITRHGVQVFNLIIEEL